MLPGNKSGPTWSAQAPCPLLLSAGAACMMQSITLPRHGGEAAPQHGTTWLSLPFLFLGRHMSDECSFANPMVHTKRLPTVRELLILLEARCVTSSQGLLKVKRWWHPQVPVQMFTVRCAEAQSGTRKGESGQMRSLQTWLQRR